MKINIITVGKLKEKYLSEAIKEYSKRLSTYVKLEIIEVADEKAPENLSKAQSDIVKRKEGERIIKCIKENTFVVTLEINGQILSSNELADKINQLGIQGKSNITFIIGGSLGLDSTVLELSDYAISFSRMTFPHQLIRVLLLEQIYRSFKINLNEPYHK